MPRSVRATYNQLCEMKGFGFPYDILRVSGPKEALEKAGFKIIEAPPAKEEDILLVHDRKYVEKIRDNALTKADKIKARIESIPVSERLYEMALASAGCAVKAFEEAGEVMCFALTQPPGHHAGRSNFAGFCVFNNAAIVAEKAKQEHGKVAILDIDVHHGNGTQDIFLGDKKVIFASIHSYPWYPGTGLRSKKNCHNYPLPYVPPLTAGYNSRYLGKLDSALEKIKNFQPDFVVVSAGFDTYIRDPLGRMTLQEGSYTEIGRRIASLRKPTVSVLEGGYVPQKMGELVVNYCSPFQKQ